MAEAKGTRELSGNRTAVADEPRSSNREDQPRSMEIKRDIEGTRAALDHKLEALQSKVREVGTKAKETFSLRHHVDEHPWAMLGASVATGFVVGAIASGHSDEDHEPSMIGWHSQPEGQTTAIGFHQPAPRAPMRRRSARGDIFDTLKLAAGAALTELVKTQINKHMPALGEQLDKVWKERGLTPTSAANAIFNRNPSNEGNA